MLYSIVIYRYNSNQGHLGDKLTFMSDFYPIFPIFLNFYANFELFGLPKSTYDPKYHPRCCIMLYSIVIYRYMSNQRHLDAKLTVLSDSYPISLIFLNFYTNFELFGLPKSTYDPKYHPRCCIMLYSIVIYRYVKVGISK